MKLTYKQIAEIATLCQKFAGSTQILIVVKDGADPTIRNKVIGELEGLYQKIKEVA